MAKKNYDKIITDNKEEIKAMLLLGATQTEIHKKLGIGKTTWYRLVKENAILIELLKQVEQDKENETKEKIAEALNVWENKPTYESLMDLAYDTVKGAPTLDGILKLARQLYPEHNHYLQVSIEEARIKRDTLELDREKLAKGVTDTNITIINDTIKR